MISGVQQRVAKRSCGSHRSQRDMHVHEVSDVCFSFTHRHSRLSCRSLGLPLSHSRWLQQSVIRIWLINCSFDSLCDCCSSIRVRLNCSSNDAQLTRDVRLKTDAGSAGWLHVWLDTVPIYFDQSARARARLTECRLCTRYLQQRPSHHTTSKPIPICVV